jgi:homogentisate 1,2-dioxygenase
MAMEIPRYLCGFGNHHESEALEGALPVGQNSPQVCPYKLYAEQLSGTAFTVPRHASQRTWLYRIKPAVCHQPFVSYQPKSGRATPDADGGINTPNQLRWSPFEPPTVSTDWVDSLSLVSFAGDASTRNGMGIYMYAANKAMEKRAFYNSDGDFLIVPEHGGIQVITEFGVLIVEQNEICVIPRAVRFQINPIGDWIRGYVLEVFNGHFELPDLGPIGSNGLANPQDFYYPTAVWEDERCDWTIVNKYLSQFYVAEQDHSPFNVVAWRGNYLPYKYDLKRFNAVNTVTHDHMDPSIFTVLTCKSAIPGVAIADFVIFPPRWAVSEHTFRPPYFHRNVMSEFMGLIHGSYEAKQDGFLPGGASLHSIGSPHGPDAKTVEVASKEDLKPARVADGTMAFMFESSFMLRTTRWAMEESGKLQSEYWKAWSDICPLFNPTEK